MIDAIIRLGLAAVTKPAAMLLESVVNFHRGWADGRAQAEAELRPVAPDEDTRVRLLEALSRSRLQPIGQGDLAELRARVLEARRQVDPDYQAPTLADLLRNHEDAQ